MAAILFVRIKSRLETKEIERRLLERRPRFLEVPGLVQKIYGRDGATGDVCGIYFFENNAALDAFRETELAQTIPAAYRQLRDVLPVAQPNCPEMMAQLFLVRRPNRKVRLFSPRACFRGWT